MIRHPERADRAGSAYEWGKRDYGRSGCGQMIGGERDEVSERTNIVPFPLRVRRVPPLADPKVTSYEFTEQELAALCRWFSAMKYAFPGTEGVMMVNHQENYSAVGLYNRAGDAPNCLVAKHGWAASSTSSGRQSSTRRVRSAASPR